MIYNNKYDISLVIYLEIKASVNLSGNRKWAIAINKSNIDCTS